MSDVQGSCESVPDTVHEFIVHFHDDVRRHDYFSYFGLMYLVTFSRCLTYLTFPGDRFAEIKSFPKAIYWLYFENNGSRYY